MAVLLSNGCDENDRSGEGKCEKEMPRAMTLDMWIIRTLPNTRPGDVMPSSTENLVSTVQIRPPAPAEAEGHSHAELLGTSLELV
jgi:hypothetical protein